MLYISVELVYLVDDANVGMRRYLAFVSVMDRRKIHLAEFEADDREKERDIPFSTCSC